MPKVDDAEEYTQKLIHHYDANKAIWLEPHILQQDDDTNCKEEQGVPAGCDDLNSIDCIWVDITGHG